MPSCASFPQGQGNRGQRGEARAACPHAPPFCANKAARTGEKGGARGDGERKGSGVPLCAPSMRTGEKEGPGATGRGAAWPRGKERRRWRRCTPHFRASEVARMGGKGGPGAAGRGRQCDLVCPLPRMKQGRRAIVHPLSVRIGGRGQGVKGGAGDNGERGGARAFMLLLRRRDGAGMWREGKGRGQHNPRAPLRTLSAREEGAVNAGEGGRGWVGGLPLCTPFLCVNGAAVNGGKEKGQAGRQLTIRTMQGKGKGISQPSCIPFLM
ncbi:hypothetical protein EDB86DRAFT_2835079 [Lactarius hatsudake]|nr:hypothetical protein EDB86DRAFT_2835079 [Lactarius hatsudake]